MRRVGRRAPQAQAEGIVHRDLKPANVLLDSSAEGVLPRVADFGLAKAPADASPSAAGPRSGVFFGTLAYAAPEQLRSAADADARSDLFSLGVLLHELLTGRLPFSGNTVEAALASRIAGHPAGLLEPGADRVVGELLAFRPEDRLADCAGLLRRVAGSPPSRSGACRP